MITPGLFREDVIAQETRAFLAQFRTAGQATPSVLNTPLAELRETRGRAIAGRLSAGFDETVPGPAGGLRLRCFVPPDACGAYLHFHGGGFVMGGPGEQDPLLDRFARECGLAVISVGYRLAPEHPFPAARDDCFAAAAWLLRQAERFGGGPLFIGGESAGAYLAVSALLRLRDQGLASAFAAALLNFGIFDLSLTPSARNWGDQFAVISTPILRRYQHDLAEQCAGLRSPAVSPMYADLAGLPPSLFTVGTLDPLLDDSLMMSRRWIAAGNAAELAVYPGGLHGFTFSPVPIAEHAVARQLAYLRERQAASS